MSLVGALNSGLKGILSTQKAVEITGNNIANVNTPGYSRQIARLSPKSAINIQGHMIGQGVKLQEITRKIRPVYFRAACSAKQYTWAGEG